MMKVTEETKLGVLSTLDKIAEAFEERDLDKMMSLFSTDEDMVVIGTGADEKRIGKSEVRSLFKRDWSQSEASSIGYNWKSISAEGKFAWAAVEATVYARIGSREIHLPSRLTIIMKKSGKEWLIVHWHASLPASGQETGEAWPMNIPVV
jgi:ketosteroid isomerase-like protein